MGKELLPNLGAEEGDDWRAFKCEPYARTAARLWSHLYSRSTRFRYPAESPNDSWRTEQCERHWPTALGPMPADPIFPWLEESDAPTAWLNTQSLDLATQDALGRRPSGPDPNRTAASHDKAFAVEAARALGLVPKAIEPLIQIIEPDALERPDALVERLDEFLHGWPDWTRGRFTLKPRFGSSGRGRVAGRDTTDTLEIRGAMPRLAKRGGAIFEPWLDRLIDLSVALYVPPPTATQTLPTILGSLELIVSENGIFRGHFGEIDSRGRVFSGHRDDEALRVDAAAVALRASDRGFYGPCGVDAFSYVESPGSVGESGRERLRSLVEFNARATMGLVTIGLVRRALPDVRGVLELTPGVRRYFLMGFGRPGVGRDDAQRIASRCPGVHSIDLGSPDEAPGPRPFLAFGRDRASLRQAHLEVLGC